jgi:hypothetical protein
MGSCAGRIFVLWLPTEPDMAIQVVEDLYERVRPGFGQVRRLRDHRAPGGHAIVAQYAGRSQVAVVDVNHGGFPGTVGVDGDPDGRFVAVYTDESGGTAHDMAVDIRNSAGRYTQRGGNTGRMDSVAARYGGR